MKKIIRAAFAALVLSVPVIASAVTEVLYCPTTGHVNMNGDGRLTLYSVPGAYDTVVADPDGEYPTEMAIAIWWKQMTTARQAGACVTLYMEGGQLHSITE